MTYNHVILADLSQDEISEIKQFIGIEKEIDKAIESDIGDFEFKMLQEKCDLLEENFYNIAMDIAEIKNPHIDWDCAEQSVFNLVAEDRRNIIDEIEKEY